MAGTKQNILMERVPFGPDLCDLATEWDALLGKSSRPTIFSSFDFVYTSCLHFKGDEEIFFLLCRDGSTGELMAIFPMSLNQEKCYGVSIQVLAHGITTNESEVDKPYPIIRHDCEPACWQRFRDYFHKEFRQWDLIDYDEFMPESHLVRSLGTLFRRPGYWTKTSPGPDSPIVQLDGEWEDFWMGHRKLRKKTRKLEKKLGDNLTYRVTGDPADVEQCLNDYIATELISWKAGEFVSDPDNQKFYHELFPKMAAKNQLFFGMLYDQEKVVSVEVAYTFGNRVFFAHGTYDPAYSDLSPGTVNSCRLIEFFHGKGFTEGDYLAGFSGYNNPWASRIEPTVNVIIRRMGWRNGVLALRHLEHHLKRRLKRRASPPDREEASDVD